jgi:hypothetical protein
MSTGTIPACGLGLTAATLSAWRDAALSLAEMERVGAHIAQCSACQERLAEYNAVARRLRAQRVPEPDERLWRAVRAEMARRPTHGARLRHVASSGNIGRNLVAVAAVLLLAVGFAETLRSIVLGRTTGVATPTATATTPQTAPIRWQQAPPPAFLSANASIGSLVVVAPSDGRTAYACVPSPPTSAAPPVVWVTHDEAAHWARAAGLPSAATAGPTTQCTLAVDANDPQTAVAVVYWQVGRLGPDVLSSSTYATRDGGASWRLLTGPEPFTITQLASGQGVTYALRSTVPQPGQPGTIVLSLSASSDGLRTWQSIDQPLTAQGLQVTAFWLDPGTGAIVVHATSTDAGVRPPAWETRDGGRTWTQLPGLDPADVAVQAPSAGKLWQICELYQDSVGHSTQANQLLCGADNGRTWPQRPTLNYAYTCLKCGGRPGTPTTEVFPMILVAIADDGAVLALVDVPQAPVTVPSSGGQPPILTLYRLPVGVNAWQSLGTLPHSADSQTGEDAYGNVIYAAGPGQGVFWSFGIDGTIRTAPYPSGG